MAPTGVACHAFGREGDCRLCDLVDLDHPASAVTLGRLDAPERAPDGEAEFWAHLARRTDGGPSTPRELVAALARRREAEARRMARHILASHPAASDLPAEAPF